MATVQVIASGVGGAIGGTFVPARGDVVFVEFSGRVSAVDPASGTVTVLGGGYTEPQSVVANTAGDTFYVSERGGRILKVDPANADAAQAGLVVGGLVAPHQLAITSSDAVAYVVEFAPGTGRLLRIDLGAGTADEVVGGLDRAVGLVIDPTDTTAYVTEQGNGGRLLQVDLGTGTATPLVTGLPNPFYLGWADAAASTLLLTERDPIDQLELVDLTASPPVAQVACATPFRPSCATATVAGTEAIVLCDQDVARVDLTATVPGVVISMPPEPLYVGGYVRVPYTLTGGLTPDDVTFVVAEGPEGGAISPSRDATFDPTRPDVMLLGGSVPGTYTLLAFETATATQLAKESFELTAEWADQDAGPAIAFTGRAGGWVTGGAWGGGPAGPQNVNVMPASGTRRIGIVLVDTADARLGAAAGTAAQAEWANELLGTTADPDGVARSVHHYFQEVSDGAFDVSLVGGAVVGPVNLPNGWTSYFDWNTDRNVWWANGNYFQAVVTAAQDLIDFDQVDSLVAVMGSLTTMVQTGTTLFSWPVAGGGNFTYHRPGETTTKQKAFAALNMPIDWETVDGRRNHETLSHEIGHNIGLPDLYMNVDGFDPTVAARDVGSWDLMSWDDPLPHLSVASKLMLGWVDPSLIRTYNFALNGGGVDETFRLQASSDLDAVPAGRSGGVEVRRADGWNYYFEYRRGQGTDIGDRQLPTDGAVFGTDVVSGVFVPPQARRQVIALANDVDGDGPVLTSSLDYEEDDPTGPAEFTFDVLSTNSDNAEVRVRYGAGGKPDPSIRPWPGGNNWQSPDIEVRNAKSDADGQWLNVPWAGHTNRVVAKVANGGDFVATDVRANFFVKDFSITGAPETPIGSATHTINPGATVEFETNWTPPANTPTNDAHYCVVVRIPLYQDPGNPAIVELTEYNNLAQSNYTRFISSAASPAVRGVSHVTVTNPYPDRTRVTVVGQQTTEWYRTYLEHQWVWLDPGETRRIGVMYESLYGDPVWDDILREKKQEVFRRPNRVSLIGMLENPLDDQLHVADASGGANIVVSTALATRVDHFDVDKKGRSARGQVVTVNGSETVDRGSVVVTIQPKGRAKGEVTVTTKVDDQGRFTASTQLEQKVASGELAKAEAYKVEAHYLGAFMFGDSTSEPVWATVGATKPARPR
jgi:M6 family metalloprotease-like protein